MCNRMRATAILAIALTIAALLLEGCAPRGTATPAAAPPAPTRLPTYTPCPTYTPWPTPVPAFTPVATEPPPMSNAFFNDSDRKGQFAFFIYDSVGTCQDFLEGKLAGQNRRRLTVIVQGLTVGRYAYPAQDEHGAWCYAADGAGPDYAIRRCAEGYFQITSVEESRRVVAVYAFAFEDLTRMEGSVQAIYCPFAVAATLPTATAAPPALATAAPTAPPTPSVPPSACPHVPLGGFYDVWRNEQVCPHLGCAVAPAEAVSGTETYLCDGTHTLWLREKRLFVAISPLPYHPGQWRMIVDESNWPDEMPLMIELAPRPQPCFPIWGRHAWLVSALHPDRSGESWARTSETPFAGALQEFRGGWLLWNGNVCFVLFADGSWNMF